MEIAVEEADGGVTVIRLRGRMDTKGAADIDTRFSLASGRKKAVMVDLTEVDFLASMGLRVLLTGARTVKANGGKLDIYTHEGDVAKVLAAAGIDTLIPMFHDRNAALAAIMPQPE
ncbi:MAG: STAS domain-containing protein [Pseudomonadota bacterium]